MIATFALIASLFVASPEEARVREHFTKTLELHNIQIRKSERHAAIQAQTYYREYFVRGYDVCEQPKTFRIQSFYHIYIIDISDVYGSVNDPFIEKPLQRPKFR